MLNSPSSRRRSRSKPSKELSLNLIPMIDALVTLIAFLLFSMSFIPIVAIESPVPVARQADLEDAVKDKPLQLTISVLKEHIEVWSPFNRIKPAKIPNEEGEPNLVGLHDVIVGVKQKFPQETKVIMVPHAGVSYDSLVSIMDAVRMVDPTDPTLFIQNEATGVEEVVQSLFPEIVFGNLLEDG